MGGPAHGSARVACMVDTAGAHRCMWCSVKRVGADVDDVCCELPRISVGLVWCVKGTTAGARGSWHRFGVVCERSQIWKVKRSPADADDARRLWAPCAAAVPAPSSWCPGEACRRGMLPCCLLVFSTCRGHWVPLSSRSMQRHWLKRGAADVDDAWCPCCVPQPERGLMPMMLVAAGAW